MYNPVMSRERERTEYAYWEGYSDGLNRPNEPEKVYTTMQETEAYLCGYNDAINGRD